LKPGGLERARVNLARQNFRSFAPRRASTERRASRLIRSQRPVFPGYIFVQIPPDRSEWRKINATYGVARLVSLDRQQPTLVSGAIMSNLFSRCDGEIWRTDVDEVRPGRQTRIVQGAFSQMIAKIDALPDQDRVIVLLDLMGRETRVALNIDDLELL